MNMRHAWHAFRQGLSQAWRYRGMLVLLYMVNLVTALLLTLIPAVLLADQYLYHPTAIRAAADGTDAWWVIEILLSPQSSLLLNNALAEWVNWIGSFAMSQLVTGALIPLLAWLPATFLRGGVLLTYHEAPAPFRWQRFLWGCWHWFGTYLLLGLLQGLLGLILFGMLITGIIALAILTASWTLWLTLPLLALSAGIWLALGEMVRAASVVHHTRHVFKSIGSAARLIARWPLQAGGFYALSLLLAGVIVGAYRWAIKPWLPLSWWLLVLIIHQLVILTRLWARLARFSGGLALYGETAQSLSKNGVQPEQA